MSDITAEVRRNSKHLRLLARQFPNMQSVFTEITNLRAILNLPKGTEHFMSDLHGEHEAFTHILNNCSGVIRQKVDVLFEETMTPQERSELCALIYYPQMKLEQIKRSTSDLDDWYEKTLLDLVALSKMVARKYSRSKVRKAMPPDFAYIIDELMHAEYGEENQSLYYSKIMESILALRNADELISAFASLIKRLAVDRLHIVGDIFDRGPRPDVIMDTLMKHHSVDIQWGNHDILWMGAAAGSEACMAGVLANNIRYGNLQVLEEGYGINLRPLSMFAQTVYRESPGFAPRLSESSRLSDQEVSLIAKMTKAITIMMFKLEGQVIMRNPEFGMEDRLLLDKINWEKGTVMLRDGEFPMNDTDLPTIDPKDPYRLTDGEQEIIDGLMMSFLHSERLHRHMRFLYSHGAMYTCFNQNLMFHGCVPMNPDGTFTKVYIRGRSASGRSLMNLCETVARTAYFGTGKEQKEAADGVWYLWCGGRSPLFGRERMTTFERRFVNDESTWKEAKDAYFTHTKEKVGCVKVLNEFGLYSDIAHIINGHVPVRAQDGESPIKGGGKLIVIDGGFCKAYQPRTGIAGYTLIYNSAEMRLSAHMPFESTQKAVEENQDIHSTTNVFETMEQRLHVMDVDTGQELSEQIYDLSLLLEAYRAGLIEQKP